jgi:hypothetical protein
MLPVFGGIRASDQEKILNGLLTVDAKIGLQ